jgi:acetyl-CoA acetyltransferase
MPDALILDAVRTPIGRYGVATMCIGVGLGLAAVIETPAT